MVALSSPKTSRTPEKLLKELSARLSGISLTAGDTFMWSPKNRTVYFVEKQLHLEKNQWSLIHEAAHALLEHRDYSTDFELLQLEVDAWKHAKLLAADLGRQIDPNFIEDCLDTYRDWLHQRSTCPTCGSGGLQHQPKLYRCHNCHTQWRVSQSRFCRPYRKKARSEIKKSPDQTDQTIFN